MEMIYHSFWEYQNLKQCELGGKTSSASIITYLVRIGLEERIG